MSGEIIAILAVGVALAGLILTSIRGLRQDIRQDMARLEFSLSAVGPTLPEPRQASPMTTAQPLTIGAHPKKRGTEACSPLSPFPSAALNRPSSV